MPKQKKTSQPAPALPRWRALLLLLLTLLLLGGAVFGTMRFLTDMKQQQLRHAYNQLESDNNSQSTLTQQWLQSEMRQLDTLSQLPFVPAAATQQAWLSDTPEAADFRKAAQNWLSTAGQTEILGGVAVAFPQRNYLFTVPEGWVLPESLNAVAARVLQTGKPQADIVPDGNQQNVFVAIVPLFENKKPVGVLLGVKPLPPSLKQLFTAQSQDNALLGLVKASNNGGALVLTGNTAQAEQLLAQIGQNALQATAQPIIVSSGNEGWLLHSRKIEGTPWLTMAAMPEARTLADITPDWEWLALAVLALLLAGVSITFLGGAMTRAKVTEQLVSVNRELAHDADYHGKLLRTVADNQARAVIIVDSGEIIRFINAPALRLAGKEDDGIIGRSVTEVFGQRTAERWRPGTREARRSQSLVIIRDNIGNRVLPRVVQVHHIPLPPLPKLPDGVLIAEDDITALISERERRETQLRQVIDTLLAVVDRRDPHAAGHSERVGRLARLLAEKLQMPANEAETCELSGHLMNFGKLLVPRAILTKADTLTEEELTQVRRSILSSADILSLITFEQPIVPTLKQVLEHVDGSGIPDGRRGEDILLTARVVAVANAFVAMASPRAHRAGLPPAEALANLERAVGRVFDKRVVMALADLLGTSGQQVWQNLLQQE